MVVTCRRKMLLYYLFQWPRAEVRAAGGCWHHGRGGLQWVRDGPRHGAVLRGQGGDGDQPGEGAHPGVHPQEHGAVPLHLRHPVQAQPGGGLRGELREDLLHHLHQAGAERDSAEVLHSPGEGLRRPGCRGPGCQQRARQPGPVRGQQEAAEEAQEGHPGPGAVQGVLRVLLHHQICREAAWQVCGGHSLRKVTCGILWKR